MHIYIIDVSILCVKKEYILGRPRCTAGIFTQGSIYRAHPPLQGGTFIKLDLFKGF